MKLLIAPHNDDETLFAAYTIQREKPLVAVVLDCYLQGLRGARITAQERRDETAAALRILGADVVFLGFHDDSPDWDGIERSLREYHPDAVWAPAVEPGGHAHHNAIGAIAHRIWPDRTRHYMTYTPAGKSRGIPVPKRPEWIAAKLRALACYVSQIEDLSTQEHYLRDQYEYYAPPQI